MGPPIFKSVTTTKNFILIIKLLGKAEQKKGLKGNGNIFFIFPFERTFKTIYKSNLTFFHILLTSYKR
jgi:hypothetical protein